MNYAQYLEKGKTIESTESLIEKVINSQGQDENALQELVNRAQSQDSKAIEFLQMLQQQSGVSKFEKPSGPIVKKDQQDPNIPVAAETGTVDGRKYTYMPYQGEGRGPIDRFEYIGQDGNTYGMTIQGPDTTYVMNGQQYNDPEGQRVIKERRAAVVREKCGGSVKKKETGDKITRKKVMAKGGCPCMIKKVGGRLIEVDSCTDLPVHRNGGNVIKLQNASQPITVNASWWHNKRYSADQIKQIQSALNKAALGKQIAVDGIFGKETAAAIRAFQQQHNDILKVDGLAGDQTLSALGVTGIGDASLPQTRAGINQAKKASIDTSTAQGKADKQASDYYNSPEMLQYLMNATNAAVGSQEYLNHYYNALNYVSPEIASKLRTLNNEGDAYDQEVSKNRGQSFNRAVGIKEFKNAVASGHLKTSDDYDRWMTSHNLSKEEMQELMNDPASSEAMLRAGVIADNGRVNSDAAQGRRFQKEVTNAINEAGVKYALPAMLAVGNVATAGASSILPLFGSAVGGRATNAAVSGLSDGQYQTWGQFASDRWGKDPNNSWLWEMTNPGAIAGAIVGGATPGQGMKVGQAKVSDAIPSQKIPAGYKWVEGYTRPITKQVELVNSPKMIPNEPFYQNPTVVKHRIPVGEQNVSGYYKKMYQTIPGKPAVYKDIRIGTKPNGYSPTLYTSSVQPERPAIDVPKYNTEVSYGPYLGTNRFQFKEGGQLNYANYLN